MTNVGHSVSNTEMAQARQRLEIEAIAREVQRPIAEVAEVFSDLESELRRNATVTDFLPVLVARRVRARYRSTQQSPYSL